MTLLKGFAACFAMAACLLGSGEAGATVIFRNTGTLSGWTRTFTEHRGSITQVTNVVFRGTTAIKAQQVFDPNYTGRYHSEAFRSNAYRRGEQGFYGFAFRLQADWQFQSQGYNIAQFIADFTNTGCDDHMPSTMIWIRGNTLNTRVKTGTPCAQRTQTFSNIASLSAGVWHRVEVQVNWQSNTTGLFRLWFDGSMVLERVNIATTVADDRPFEFRVGIYANGWHDDGRMVGTQGTRAIWFDQIGIATTFAEADPAAW